MRGYTLLNRTQYAFIYGLTAAVLLVAALGTYVGFWEFGGLLWWPVIVLLLVVALLEAHGVYVRRSA